MTRNLQLDILRLVSILAMVLIHVIAQYEENNIFQMYQFKSWFVEIVNKSLFWCVPILFMLSGTLLLSKDNEPMSVFYMKRMYKVLIPTIFWSATFLLYLCIYKDFTLVNVIGALLKGNPFYHLWFMYAIIGLYIFTPYIRILLTNLSEIQTKWLIALLFIFSIGHNYLSYYLGNQGTIFSSFLSYIGYFILGYELYKYKDRAAKYLPLLLTVFLMSVLMAATATTILKFILQIKFPLIDYYTPFIAIQAISLYMYVIGKKFVLKVPNRLKELSELSFGVYLIHPLFIIALIPYMTIDKLYLLPLFYLLVLGCSYTTVYFMSRIKYMKALV